MEYFNIGKIVNTQGIKGDVRIMPFTDDITRFELLKSVTVSNGKNQLVLDIERIWYHKQFVIIKFKDINDMTQGERLKNYTITIPRTEALPLNKDEYYISDLYGLKVICEDGQHLGELTDILFTGANDVYVVKNNDEEILLPAIKQCILKVDIENKEMTVKILEGLR